MAPGRRNRVIPRSVWYLITAAAAARWQDDAAAIIIILSHYNNIIAHFFLLVKPFAHFLADVEVRPFCPVRRLSNLNMLSSPSINQWKRFHNFVQKQQDPNFTWNLISRWPKHHMSRARASIDFSAQIFTARQSCGL